MGRMLGAFDDDNNLDRPDLNKCPDCSCFFAGNNCPICGKECPEEFRAGNRRPEKKKKEKMPKGAIFIDWYHRWWFIILMMFVMPVVGIILLVTSPHEKWKKILFAVLAGVYMFVGTFGISSVINQISAMFSEPVNTSFSREEYIDKCQEISVESFYRHTDDYHGKYVTMTLTVEEKVFDYVGYHDREEYTTYYVCSDENGSGFKIMIRNCIQDGSYNFVKGDVIKIYGEGAGNITIEDSDFSVYTHPCIFVAYIADK